MNRRFRGILFDMDGVLYHGSQRLAGVLEFFTVLELPYRFVTNNSSRTPTQVLERLHNMEIPATVEQILTSALVAADYLHRTAPPAAKVYVVGEVGLRTALIDEGFRLTDDQPDYVVVGLDRAFDEAKLTTAVTAIRNGASFIATNMDRVLMNETGSQPGTGTIVDRIAEASGQTPLVMGKPERPMFEMAAVQMALALEDLLMIGDNLETDILGAKRAGITAALVLTGVTKRADLVTSPVQPDLVLENLLDLLKS
ncbi:MAG: HAD-IIA family hydrolase [Anaerolineales bacterium]|nr:HAD-IIA family hydrolase [Anaerolineales bacterium]